MHWQDTVFESVTGFMLLKRCYDSYLDPLIRRTGLTRIEIEILLFLSHNPNLNTATEISEKRLFTKSHVSTALKHLEQLGYIRRYFDIDNKKTIYISLEPAAFDIVREGVKKQKEFAERMVQGIDESELEAFNRTRVKILTNAAEEANII